VEFGVIWVVIFCYIFYYKILMKAGNKNEKFFLLFKTKAITIIFITGLIAVTLVLNSDLIDINTGNLQKWIKDGGMWAPLVYISLWVVCSLFFLPVIPLNIMGGIVFGPVMGSVYTSLGATLEATTSFLLGRYLLHSLISEWVVSNKKFSGKFRQINRGVKANGWKMLTTTRLVPVFPFHLQNYMYGITGIRLTTYVFVSWVCMIPANAAYCFLGTTFIRRAEGIKQNLVYIGAAAAFFLLVLFLYRRYREIEIN